MTDTAKHTLYICYFGLRQPLVQTQVIPYLQEIAKAGIKVSLLTFEPELNDNWTNEQIEAMRYELSAKNIKWECLAYHKWPSAIVTGYDIFVGVRFVCRKTRHENIDVLHGRVHVATLMGAIARKFSKRKPKLIFDIRGFFPEEYTDAGVWPENGWLYRAAKRVEKWLLKEADGFVVLTEKAREILFPEISADPGYDKYGRWVEVIPCCVDLKRFKNGDESLRQKTRRELGVSGRFVIAYVGSFGGWYLSDEVFDLFAAARELDPSVFILVLTQRQTEVAVEMLKAKGFGDNDFFVRSISPTEIPYYLNAADAAISFIKLCYSKQASSPTKNAEYLAAGLPIIANSGVGDVDRLISDNGLGVLIDSFDRDAYIEAIGRLKTLGDIAEKCRETAKLRFDLETVGGVRYRRLYEKLFAKVGD